MDKNIKKQAALKILGIVTATIGTFLAIPKAAELLTPTKDEEKQDGSL